MKRYDVVVGGAGISGLSFAFQAARAGRRVLVLEREGKPGGCLASHRAASGYWFELGAHTCYNSYTGFAELVEACGLRGEVLPRIATHLRFVDGDRLVPGSNLAVLLRLFSWWEAAVSLPRLIGAKKEGETVRSFYSRIVGKRNYEKVLGPMLSAVPSQNADLFPAGMLFKSRSTRRQDFPRSFTLRGGLQSMADRLAAEPGIELTAGRTLDRVERAGDGFTVVAGDGERIAAGAVALASGPSSAARIVAEAFPDLSAVVSKVREAEVETMAFAVRSSKISLPVSMFLVPESDLFHSVVTRDSVPDPDWRSFSFHFKPGLTRDGRIARATRLLGLAASDLEEMVERKGLLPSPTLGHEEIVREVDRLTAPTRLALLGNWFAGLAIEDCVDRSRSEWQRLA
jgi:protoporphyrinogen/coproporphyrinogen III oxidase